ncbi:MAG: flagellar motor switch protein FliN [Parvularculaceae bacterium]|nr:flagellar motor switch protein FliN [Parvularculaceae bacterium]
MTASGTAITTDVIPDLETSAAGAGAPVRRPRLESVYDIPVKVSAVLGKKRMSVSDLMTLDAGSIIELDRRVGEPIDLYINDTLIARGELVMVDGQLGVTMTEIVRANEG